MDLEYAKQRAKNELHKKENLNIFVTVPDGAVYLNTKEERLKKHCEENKLDVIHVKIDGVIQTEIKKTKKTK